MIDHLGVGGGGQIYSVVIYISGIRRSIEIEHGAAVVLTDVVANDGILVEVACSRPVVDDQEAAARIVVAVVVLDDRSVALVIRVKGHGVTTCRRIVHLIELNHVVFGGKYPEWYMVTACSHVSVMHDIVLDQTVRCI
ncbi:hypothetical protein D3C76_78890 [compost metagenome]